MPRNRLLPRPSLLAALLALAAPAVGSRPAGATRAPAAEPRPPAVAMFSHPAPARAPERRAAQAHKDDPFRVPAALQERIDAAIDAGVEALLLRQEIDGSWREQLERYQCGATALVAYALLESGLPPSHPALERALTFMRLHPSRKTYGVATSLLFTTSLEDRRHELEPWIEELADQLISFQRRDGFGYPEGEIDLSNTQYAAFGLYFARRHGVSVPVKVWKRLAEAVLDIQEPLEGTSYDPAGFGYRAGLDPTGSMTAAGVAVLAIAAEALPRKDQRVLVGLQRGLAWLARHFDVRTNPHPAWSKPGQWDPADHHLLYYLYGLERVAALCDLARIGEREWYREGAEHLVTIQEGSGLWQGSQSRTAFALLFLNRATATGPRTGGAGAGRSEGLLSGAPGDDVRLRLAMGGEMTGWIESIGERARRRYGVGESEPRPIHVVRVCYLARPAGAPAEREFVLATVEADPTEPAPLEARYPARLELPGPGTWEVRARVSVLEPGWDVTSDLFSTPLSVRTGAADGPELDAYARDSARNLLLDARLEVSASSKLDQGRRPELAVDGYQGTGWLSADDDPLPLISIELHRPVRADTLLLSHFFDFHSPSTTRTARAGRIRVTLDHRRKDALEFDLSPRVDRKSVLSLGRPRRITRIDIEVLAATPSADPVQAGVGFNEIELVLDRGGH